MNTETVTPDPIAEINAEIVRRVESLHRQQEEKKDQMSVYNETIKALKAEIKELTNRKRDLEEGAKQLLLIEEADELLENNARPGEDSLSLID